MLEVSVYSCVVVAHSSREVALYYANVNRFSSILVGIYTLAI